MVQCNCKPGGCNASQVYDKFNYAIYKTKQESYSGAFANYTIILLDNKTCSQKRLLTNNSRGDNGTIPWIRIRRDLELAEYYFAIAFPENKYYIVENSSSTPIQDIFEY